MDTFRKILKECSAKREMLYLAQSSSGMRIGEMVQLRKRDVHTDMARLMVKIPAAFTKTGVARITFFSAEAAKLVAPRLKKIGDSDLVFGTGNARSNARYEAKYLANLQKRMGMCDKYETTGRNVITTHSFRAYFITKVSRRDPNLAKYFAGQKGYLLQYDRQTDKEKLANYMEFEPLLLVSDKARDQERIRNLENENAKVVELEKKKSREFERKAMEFERKAMEFERKAMESERRNKDLERKFYKLEDAIHKSITKQSGGLARQAEHVNKGGTTPCTSRHEAAKTQSPDHERGNRDVN